MGSQPAFPFLTRSDGKGISPPYYKIQYSDNHHMNI